MREIKHRDGFTIVNDYPDETPEETEQAIKDVIQKMFILFSNLNKSD